MHGISLRYSLPLLIVSIGAVAAVLSYVLSVEHAVNRIENQRRVEFRDQLTRAQGVMESALHANDMPAIQRFVSSFGTDERLELLLLADRNGKVLASTNLGYLKEDVSALDLKIEGDLIKKSALKTNNIVSLVQDGGYLLGLISVCYDSGQSNDLRKNSCGLLYIRENLRSQQERATRSLREQALINSAGFLVVALLFLLLLDRLVTKRVGRLVSVNEAFASGQTDVRVDIRGRDELAVIGGAINTMLDQISSDRVALAESEERFSLAMEGANDGLWDWNLKTNEVYYSPRWCGMLGYRPDELDQTLDTWGGLVAPEDKDRILHLVQDYVSGAVDSFETEFRMRHKNGSWVTVLSRAFLVRKGGEAVRLVGTHVDITKRLELEAQVRQAQKMESIGTLAGGVAHELNNILTPIQGLTELMLDDVPEGSTTHRNLGYVLKSTHRAAELVKKILSFSRRDSPERKPLDLRNVVEDQVALLRSALPATIELKLDLGRKPLIVLADETQIHQVLMNLASNAAHAMRGRTGPLRISLSSVDFRGDEDCGHLRLSRGHYARLSVSDTGHGISDQTLARIFEPFFTTKDVGEGTGMGLAVIHGIVASHGGAVDVVSRPGLGTTFHIYIPLQ